MRTEIRKLSWGGSLRYQTTTCTIPKSMLELWTRDGHLPTHVQVTQSPDGTVSIVPVTWPPGVQVPVLQLAVPEDLEDTLFEDLEEE